MVADSITKEFLEFALKTLVTKFVVNTGSSSGDGYTCVIYSKDVWPTGQEPLPLVVKCFPTNPGQQQMLEESGIFATELGMYEEVIPTLNSFLQEKSATDIQLPFPRFFAAKQTPLAQGGQNPSDNFLMMADLRKAGEFSVRDRFYERLRGALDDGIQAGII